MNEPTHVEDQIIETLLWGDPLAVEVGDTVEERALTREYTELLGLLPQALDPVEPRPELKSKVLEAMQAEVGAAAGVPTRPPGPSLVPVSASADSGDADSGTKAPGSARVLPMATLPRRRASWPLALAASVAFLLAGFCAYLFLQLQETRVQLAQVQDQLASLVSPSLATDIRQASTSEARLEKMLEDNAVLCKLWPVTEGAHKAGARGLLVVASDHQQWLLQVVGLEPAPQGKMYRVWFMTPEGPVAGGVLSFVEGQKAEVAAPRMPNRVQAVAVTLESGTDTPTPAGERVLYGEEKMTLL